ncbi:MAG: hypothetical protein ACXVMS_12505 [Flavisolibacter sp.]
MTITQLKTELKIKSLEFEAALEATKSHKELLTLYRHLKQIQFDIIQADVAEFKGKEVGENAEDLVWKD